MYFLKNEKIEVQNCPWQPQFSLSLSLLSLCFYIKALLECILLSAYQILSHVVSLRKSLLVCLLLMFSSCKILAHLLNELLEWCAQERREESKLISIEHLLCIRHFFFVLRFYPPVQKGIVTHNLHTKNQHSECEWFWGNNYKEISMKSWQTLNNSRGLQNAWPLWSGIWGNLPK